MSKTFETKQKIIDILKEGAKTPTEISMLLGLSPSTVSQHLKELKMMGQIYEFPDEHFKNIKYYQINERRMPVFQQNTSKFIITVIGAAVIIAILFFSYSNSIKVVNTTGFSQNNVGVFLTDPPQVPYGTQALTVSYSSLAVQVVNNSGSYWIRINGSGSVDLLSLVNLSKDLSSFNLPGNSRPTRISFNLTNATIEINDTQYPVTIPDKQVSVKVYSNVSSNSSFDILVDMFPTIYPSISENQTTFTMAPSAAAAAVSKKDNPYYAKGSGLAPLNGPENSLIRKARAQIILSNASISRSGNRTSISVTVTDTSNVSTGILGVIILGNYSYTADFNVSANFNASANQTFGRQPAIMPYPPYRPPTATGGWQGQPNVTTGQNYTPNFASGHGRPNGVFGSNWSAQQNSTMPAPEPQPMPAYMHFRLNNSQINALISNYSNGSLRGRLSGIINANQFGTPPNAPFLSIENGIRLGRAGFDISALSYMKTREDMFRTINLLVSQNGTMYQPSPPRSGLRMQQLIGYQLNQSSTATLKYDGVVSFGRGKLIINTRPGDKYQIIVIGTNGAHASINVTAG